MKKTKTICDFIVSKAFDSSKLQRDSSKQLGGDRRKLGRKMKLYSRPN